MRHWCYSHIKNHQYVTNVTHITQSPRPLQASVTNVTTYKFHSHIIRHNSYSHTSPATITTVSNITSTSSITSNRRLLVISVAYSPQTNFSRWGSVFTMTWDSRKQQTVYNAGIRIRKSQCLSSGAFSKTYSILSLGKYGQVSRILRLTLRRIIWIPRVSASYVFRLQRLRIFPFLLKRCDIRSLKHHCSEFLNECLWHFDWRRHKHDGYGTETFVYISTVILELIKTFERYAESASSLPPHFVAGHRVNELYDLLSWMKSTSFTIW